MAVASVTYSAVLVFASFFVYDAACAHFSLYSVSQSNAWGPWWQIFIKRKYSKDENWRTQILKLISRCFLSLRWARVVRRLILSIVLDTFYEGDHFSPLVHRVVDHRVEIQQSNMFSRFRRPINCHLDVEPPPVHEQVLNCQCFVKFCVCRILISMNFARSRRSSAHSFWIRGYWTTKWRVRPKSRRYEVWFAAATRYAQKVSVRFTFLWTRFLDLTSATWHSVDSWRIDALLL